MTRLSHKALKEVGKGLNGNYFDGNIYAHENRVYYLSSWRLLHAEHKVEMLAEIEHHEHEILALAEEVANLGADYTNATQLAYSCGTYGNIGQLHRIDYYKDDEIIKTLYLYV